MKNFLAILLIAQVGSIQIFQGGIIGEIFKLQNIATHFQEHKRLEESISFIEFISMHYGDESEHRGMHTHTEPFPFHKCSCATHFFAILPEVNSNLKKEYNSQNLTHVRVESENRILSFNGDVWLPPKL